MGVSDVAASRVVVTQTSNSSKGSEGRDIFRIIHDAQRSGALGALLCNYGDSGKEVQCFVPNLFIYMPDISGH